MPTLQEVRARYPQYADLSDEDLADKLHAKFYSDMDKAAFYGRIGMKQPDPLGISAEPEKGVLEGVRDYVGGVADAATQGMTFGFADELGAGVRAGARYLTDAVQGKDADFGKLYDERLGQIRGEQKAFDAANPVSSTIANVAGGLATGAPLASKAAASAASLPATIGKLTATGAGYGALGGFGSAEGGVDQRLEGAAAGGVAGAALGATLPVVARGVGKAVGAIRNASGLRDPVVAAQDHILRAMERDGIVPTRVAADLTASTKPTAMVDAGGKNMLRLGRTVEAVPGQGSDEATRFLNERQMAQPNRVNADLERGISGMDFYGTKEALDAARKEAAAPLYDIAYNVPFVWSKNLEGLFNRPHIKSSMSRAYRIAAEEGRNPQGLGLAMNEAGDTVIEPTAASMQTLDYIKRGLDDEIEKFRNKVTGKLWLDEEGRAIDATRRRFLQLVDDMNPVYKAAREVWAGPTQSMDAMALGRDFARGDPEMTIARFRSLSPQDQDYFRVGVARELQGMVENTRDGINAVRKFFGSQGQRSRLRQIFKDEASFKAFEKAMEDEMRMSATRNVVTGGSPTGRIAAEQDDAASGAGEALVDLATGGVRGALLGAARRGVTRARGINEPTSLEISRMLFNPDRKEIDRIAKMLEARKQRQGALSQLRGGLAMQTLAGGSNVLGQELVPAGGLPGPR